MKLRDRVSNLEGRVSNLEVMQTCPHNFVVTEVCDCFTSFFPCAYYKCSLCGSTKGVALDKVSSEDKQAMIRLGFMKKETDDRKNL